jgi:flagellar protein FlaG
MMDVSKLITGGAAANLSPQPVEPAKQIKQTNEDRQQKSTANVEQRQKRANREESREASKQELGAMFEGFNEFMESAELSLRFSIHEKSEKLYIRLVDDESGEVVREFPPKEILEMAARLKEMMEKLVGNEKALGLLVDHTL